MWEGEETQTPIAVLHSRECVSTRGGGQTVRQARSRAFSEDTSVGHRSLDSVSERQDFSSGPTMGAQ